MNNTFQTVLMSNVNVFYLFDISLAFVDNDLLCRPSVGIYHVFLFCHS